jgi:hypothetical protein
LNYRLPGSAALEMRSDTEDILWDNSNIVGLCIKRYLEKSVNSDCENGHTCGEDDEQRNVI